MVTPNQNQNLKYSPATRLKARKFREESGLNILDISARMGIPESTIRGWARTEKWKQPKLIEVTAEYEPTDQRVIQIEKLERQLHLQRAESQRQNAIHRSLVAAYEEIEKQMGIMDKVGPPNIHPISKSKSTGLTEACLVAVASDWHIEEEVKPEAVNGLNKYDLTISRARAKKFFSKIIRLKEIVAADVKVKNMVLPLLGDFITNQLHDENAENNLLTPTEAIITCQDYLASGISFLLENSDLDIFIPCHTGNHGRTTKTAYHQTEFGHSLEWLMYMNLVKFFQSEDRVEFNVPRSYHSYQTIYDLRVRYSHGHQVKYNGGVGGITIPVNKAIAQWNKARKVDLDIFGHFHTFMDGGNFLCNGSLIGHSPYGISIKASFERPQQIFTVVDSTHGKTCTWPILVE
jgi:transposase-like protein